jgi:hypothetical protein
MSPGTATPASVERDHGAELTPAGRLYHDSMTKPNSGIPLKEWSGSGATDRLQRDGRQVQRLDGEADG